MQKKINNDEAYNKLIKGDTFDFLKFIFGNTNFDAATPCYLPSTWASLFLTSLPGCIIKRI